MLTSSLAPGLAWCSIAFAENYLGHLCMNSTCAIHSYCFVHTMVSPGHSEECEPSHRNERCDGAPVQYKLGMAETSYCKKCMALDRVAH